jgi:hypothetical protein
VAIADGGRGGEVRVLVEVANKPAAVERLIRKLAGRYGKLYFCYEDGVIPARRCRFRECGIVVSAQGMGRAPGAARRDPEGAGGAGAQTRGRTARHVERRAGVPVASFGGIGVGRGIRCFSELPPSPSGNGGKGLPRGRDGVGRERGYPLGARGCPHDADYEDGSVLLQLPLSCADHRIEARREGCHLRES